MKEFVVVPGTSRALRPDGTMAEKLALDILLVPAVVDPTIDPEDGLATDPSVGCGCSTPGGDLPSLGLLVIGVATLIRRRRRAEVV